MGKRDGPLVFRPELLDQVPFRRVLKSMPDELQGELRKENEVINGKRRSISMRNTSLFFTQLYVFLNGGEIQRDTHGNLVALSNGESRSNFRPDIIARNGNNLTYTEVKAYSTNGSYPWVGLVQMAHYCKALFDNLVDHNNLPEVNYAFVKYGKKTLKRLGNLPLKDFVKTLSNEQKFFTIMPLNLVFFLSAFSKVREEDHTNSLYGRNSEDYLHPLPEIMNRFHKGKLEGLIADLDDESFFLGSSVRYIGDLTDYFLKDLECTTTKSSEISVRFREEDFIMSSFPITTYSLPEESYRRWFSYFAGNRDRILDNLGLKDYFLRVLYNEEGFHPSEDERYSGDLDIEVGNDSEEEVPDEIPF